MVVLRTSSRAPNMLGKRFIPARYSMSPEIVSLLEQGMSQWTNFKRSWWVEVLRTWTMLFARFLDTTCWPLLVVIHKDLEGFVLPDQFSVYLMLQSFNIVSYVVLIPNYHIICAVTS